MYCKGHTKELALDRRSVLVGYPESSLNRMFR